MDVYVGRHVGRELVADYVDFGYVGRHRVCGDAERCVSVLRCLLVGESY